jgi:Ca2+/H+ antiporter, TMEM165/GDT1 family
MEAAVNVPVTVTTFLAAGIEVIEMVAIVVAVGGTRSWRAALAGAGAGLVVLAALITALGTALRDVPLQPIRLVVGALLLVFGLQWLRKGALRIAAQGWAVGQGEEHVDDGDVPPDRFDWTGFVLSFKGVSLEGLEIAIIVVAVGGAAGALGSATTGAAAAVLVLAAVGAATYRLVARIPRRALQLFVGALLSSFGTFWAGQGVGVGWPGGELALLWLVALYAATGVVLLHFVRGWQTSAAPSGTAPMSGELR